MSPRSNELDSHVICNLVFMLSSPFITKPKGGELTLVICGNESTKDDIKQAELNCTVK